MNPAPRVRGRRRQVAAPSRVGATRGVALVVLGLSMAGGCATTDQPGGAGATGAETTGATTGPTPTVPATTGPAPTAGDSAPGPTGPAPTGDVGTDDPQAYAEALFAGTNRVRAEEGLPALTWSTCAAGVASERAEDLVGDDGLEHAPMDPVLEACAPATRAAENLSRAGVAAGDVVDAWMGSPGHRANLLSAEVTELGVACVPDGGPLVCSQIFLGP